MSDVYDLLREPFDEAAYSADTGRGFELTSIKAAYVLERMNEVFGLCGTGWRYAHSVFDEINKEIVTWVAVQYAVEDGGCGRVEWDAMIGHWRIVEGTGWSEPIYTVGGNQVGKGSVPVTDAKKSAITNGITKALSVIGVGSDVFKGLVRVGKQSQPQRRQQSSQPAQKARERAKSPKSGTGKSTGKSTRPVTPAQLRTMLQAKVDKRGDGGKIPASEKQVPFLSRKFQEAFGGDDDTEKKYHLSLEWLWKVDRAKKLSLGEAAATLDWLLSADGADDTGDTPLHEHAPEEARHVWREAMKDAGQSDMFEEPEEASVPANA